MSKNRAEKQETPAPATQPETPAPAQETAAPEQSPAGFEIIAQMTFKKMGCKPQDAVKAKKPRFVVRVWGEAVAVKGKEARSGDVYDYLIGQFRAETAEGKQYESAQLSLPAGVLNQIQVELHQNKNKPVQFAYDFFAQPDATVSIGYTYAAKALLQTAATDRLAQIGGALQVKPLPVNAAS